MEGISELAKLFKERDNKPYLGPQLGNVINPPPEIKVSLGEKIILTKEHLVLSAHILKDYVREFEIESVDIECSKGKIKFTDTLKIGDQVMLIPTTDEQKYYVIDKVVNI